MSLHGKLERVDEAFKELMKSREAVKKCGEKLARACDAFRDAAEEMYGSRIEELEDAGYGEREIEGDKRTRLLMSMSEGEHVLSAEGDIEGLWNYETWKELSGGMRKDITINRRMIEDMQASNKWPAKKVRSEGELVEESVREMEAYEAEADTEQEPDELQPEDWEK